MYVFQGEVLSVEADSVLMSVKGATTSPSRLRQAARRCRQREDNGRPERREARGRREAQGARARFLAPDSSERGCAASGKVSTAWFALGRWLNRLGGGVGFEELRERQLRLEVSLRTSPVVGLTGTPLRFRLDPFSSLVLVRDVRQGRFRLGAHHLPVVQ